MHIEFLNNDSKTEPRVIDKINQLVYTINLQRKQLESLGRALETTTTTINNLNTLIENLERRVSNLRRDIDYIDSDYL